MRGWRSGSRCWGLEHKGIDDASEFGGICFLDQIADSDYGYAAVRLRGKDFTI